MWALASGVNENLKKKIEKMPQSDVKETIEKKEEKARPEKSSS